MEFLRDPIWQFIGAILAMAGIVTAIWIYLLQKNKKNLSYEILVNNEILSTNEELKGKIKITFNKKAIQNIQLLIIKVKNNGNASILPSDFYRELQISFGEKVKILSTEITEYSLQSLQLELVKDEKSVNIRPTLLNSKDYFVMKFLLSQFDGSIRIDGRITGIKDIQMVKESTAARFVWQSLIILIGSAILIINEPLSSPESIFIALNKIGVLVILFVTVIGLTYYLTKTEEIEKK